MVYVAPYKVQRLLRVNWIGNVRDLFIWLGYVGGYHDVCV